MHAREFGGALAWKTRALEALATSRHRLLDLLRPLPPEVLVAQHSPLMSPAVWDVAHVANYEEQWLLRALGERGLSGPETDRLYDAFRNPRRTRGGAAAARAGRGASPTRSRCRARALRRLDAVTDEDVARTGPLLDGGFVYGMVAQHEQQHVETLVATLQLVTSTALDPLPAAPPPRSRSLLAPEVHVPGGSFEMGRTTPGRTTTSGPRHAVHVPAFFIDRYPVTNGEFLAFMDDGGYTKRTCWNETGWAFRQEERLEHPLFWRRAGNGWERRRFGTWEPLPPRRAGAAMSAGTRRTRTRGGRAGGFRPRPSGRRRRPRTPRRHGAALPLGRRPAGPDTGEPLAARRDIPPRRCVPGRGQRVRRRAADRGRLGVDGLRFPAISGVSGVPVPGVFGRLLRQ